MHSAHPVVAAAGEVAYAHTMSAYLDDRELAPSCSGSCNKFSIAQVTWAIIRRLENHTLEVKCQTPHVERLCDYLLL
jgi:hypothetical protein